MPEFVLDFKANPKQKEFIESRARADLFSSRMGEGKSAGLCWAILYHTRHNPGANWILIRDTWENLRRTTLEEFFKWFPPGIAGTYHKTDKEFHWASGIASGKVTMMGMDDPDDAGKLQSLAIAGAAFDEPAPASTSGGIDETIFDVTLSRTRQAGMKWYGLKLAQNNSDESHWTYRRFVQPGDPAFKYYQPSTPENEANLPPDYYAEIRARWGHRPDLIKRFLDGQFGFTAKGKAVTPQWSDSIHLAIGLRPIRGRDLVLCWDFGLNPTCVITQMTPAGYWNVLYSFVGEGEGVAQLIERDVAPILTTVFKGYRFRHIGDPAGKSREGSDSRNTAAKMVTRLLGGRFTPGPVRTEERLEPLRAMLTKINNGRGILQVDPVNAKHVWLALRGNWHYNVSHSGITSTEPAKDEHSHPGDALAYGAAILFPGGKLQKAKSLGRSPLAGSAWSTSIVEAPEQLGANLRRQGSIIRPREAGLILPR